MIINKIDNVTALKMRPPGLDNIEYDEYIFTGTQDSTPKGFGMVPKPRGCLSVRVGKVGTGCWLALVT